MSGEMESNRSGRRTVRGTAANFRMVSDGPSTASGGMIALTRDPSCSRASTRGEDSSIRRPIRATMRSMTVRRCASELNVRAGQVQAALRAPHRCGPAPLTMISETSGSSRSRWRGPRPRTSSTISRIRRRLSSGVRGTCSSSMKAPTASTNHAVDVALVQAVSVIRLPRRTISSSAARFLMPARASGVAPLRSLGEGLAWRPGLPGGSARSAARSAGRLCRAASEARRTALQPVDETHEISTLRWKFLLPDDDESRLSRSTSFLRP